MIENKLSILAGRIMLITIAFGFGAAVQEVYPQNLIFLWVALILLICAGLKCIISLRAAYAKHKGYLSNILSKLFHGRQ